VISQNQKTTEDDYSFDRDTVSTLVRRIDGEKNVPPGTYDWLERFVDQFPNADMCLVMNSFIDVAKGDKDL
jgi:hypothetical protein